MDFDDYLKFRIFQKLTEKPPAKPISDRQRMRLAVIKSRRQIALIRAHPRGTMIGCLLLIFVAVVYAGILIYALQ